MKTTSTIELEDLRAWERLGAHLARQNQPTEPDGNIMVRDMVRATLTSRAQDVRDRYVDEVGAVDAQRSDLHFRLPLVRALPKEDSRAAMADILHRQLKLLNAERAELHDTLRLRMRELIGKASAADATWRTANQQHRTRRGTVNATLLSIPPEMEAAIPDPLQ